MDWETIADIATTVGTVVALSGVLVTLVLTLRSERLTREGQELERTQAEATAARSEAAASLTEEYTRRVVDALETIAHGGGAPTARGSAAPRQVRWSMRNNGGDTYILENVSDTRADGVQVKAHPSMMIDTPDRRDLGPGEAVEFMAVRTMGTEDSTITVEWVDPRDGSRRSWRYPLPPRPPRARP